MGDACCGIVDILPWRRERRENERFNVQPAKLQVEFTSCQEHGRDGG